MSSPCALTEDKSRKLFYDEIFISFLFEKGDGGDKSSLSSGFLKNPFHKEPSDPMKDICSLFISNFGEKSSGETSEAKDCGMKNQEVAKRANDVPVFKQISNILDDEIEKLYRPNDILPSETDLAKRFKVNRHTVRRAISELVTLGRVGTLQGKGTIVQQKLFNYSIHSTTRFTETLENGGRQAESLVLKKIGIQAQPDIAEMLDIDVGRPVILVETLRKMDGAPFSVVSHFLLLDQVFEVMRTYNGGSLHAFLLQHYGIKLRRKISLISAVAPNQFDLELLEITRNHPMLRVMSVNIDQTTGQPLELAIARIKGISTQLSVEPAWSNSTP